VIGSKELPVQIVKPSRKWTENGRITEGYLHTYEIIKHMWVPSLPFIALNEGISVKSFEHTAHAANDATRVKAFALLIRAAYEADINLNYEKISWIVTYE